MLEQQKQLHKSALDVRETIHTACKASKLRHKVPKEKLCGDSCLPWLNSSKTLMCICTMCWGGGGGGGSHHHVAESFHAGKWGSKVG